MPKRRNSGESDKLARKRIKLLRSLEKIDRKRRRVGRISSSESSSGTDSDDSANSTQQTPQHLESDIICSESERMPPESEEVPPKEVNAEVVRLLGEMPTGAEPLFGSEVHQALAERWNKYLTLGIGKSEKEELESKYLVPKNIAFLRAPLLNPELETSLSDPSKKEDKYIATIQKHVGVALAAIAGVINQVLKNEEMTPNTPLDIKSQMLPSMVDAGKMLCDVFHMISTNRKYHVEAHLNSTVKRIVRESKPDEFLCGKDFADKFKEVKTQLRTGKEMKNTYLPLKHQPSTSKKTFPDRSFAMNSSTSQSLNYQPNFQKGKMKDSFRRKDRYQRTERPNKQSYHKRNYQK